MANKLLSQRLLLRVGLLLALAPFLGLTAFTQPFFDDFRNAYWAREHGIWGVQSWLFQTWTGRFTSTFFMAALNPVTHGWLNGVKVVAAGFFVGLWASMAYFIRTLLRIVLRQPCSWGPAIWMAALLLALFCNAAPAPFSFLYWFCGAVAYQLPLIGLLVFVALALRTGWGPAPGQWRSAGLACGPLVLAVVGNELTLVQAMPVLALLGYLLPAAARPKWWLWMAVGGVATAVAVLAPGNWLRAAAMAPPTDPLYAYRWLVLGPRTAYSLVIFLLKPLIGLSLLAAAAAGLWLGHAHRSHGSPTGTLSRRYWGLVLLAFVVLNSIGFLLFRYLLVGPPLTRAQNEIMLVLLLSTTALTWFAAWQLPLTARQDLLIRRSGPWLTLLLAGLLSAGHLPEAWRELCTSAAPFDAQMQARFAALRAAHQASRATVVLPPLRLPYGHVLIPLRQFSTDIEFDIDLSPGCAGNINGVMERYFEVPDVCADAAAPALPPPR